MRPRTPAPGIALPAKKEPYQLPQGIEPKTARHDRVRFKVAVEEPEVRSDIELCDDFTFAVLSAVRIDLCQQ